VIFVDTNVAMYAVGRRTPIVRRYASACGRCRQEGSPPRPRSCRSCCTRTLPVGRLADLDAALRLLTDLAVVWPVTVEDVQTARLFADRHPALGARDLLHLAVCARNDVDEVWTYDRGLAAAFGSSAS
jgi:uncharacterized protein